MIYQGTINANPTAAADPVNQGIAVTAVRFDLPIEIYRPSTIEFTGVQPGSDTTSYPINVSFPLTEWIPETIDPSEPPTFQVTYTVEDLDGNQQTGNADLDVSVYPCLGWKVYAFNGFQNYLRWYDYSEAPVGLGSGRTRIRNYLPVPTEGDPYNPNAGGGTAILTFP